MVEGFGQKLNPGIHEARETKVTRETRGTKGLRGSRLNGGTRGTQEIKEPYYRKLGNQTRGSGKPSPGNQGTRSRNARQQRKNKVPIQNSSEN